IGYFSNHYYTTIRFAQTLTKCIFTKHVSIAIKAIPCVSNTNDVVVNDAGLSTD
ncbi:hypothetical protein ScPMuIL_015766, partial [Solemya velum]